MAVLNHLPKSSRRPVSLQPQDYDHEIVLIDRSRTSDTSRSRSLSIVRPDADASSTQSLRRHSTDLRRKRTQLRNEITKRRYAKYQDRREGLESENEAQLTPNLPEDAEVDATPAEDNGRVESEQRGRPITADTGRSHRSKAPPETAIDILYENQRGGFLCGIPLFSSKALGAADLPPWTNYALKPSATDITNAQPPDPSWEWDWKEWKVNHEDEVAMDEDGWEYSFMFSKKFSWHGPTWFNSYVRRRAWIRRRVRKVMEHKTIEAHMLNSDYFTIHPKDTQSIAASRTTSKLENSRWSISSLARREMEEALERDDIRNIGQLMKSLRFSRIDREKTEAVESFVAHGGDDLFYLKERMHDVMSTFIFQASRKSLLSHLANQFDEAIAKLKDLRSENGDSVDDIGTGREENDFGGDDENNNDVYQTQRRVDYLRAAVQAADNEVKRLEFWSDIKDIAEHGETKGALDPDQGWTREWRGLDESGPRDVITQRKLPGFGDEDPRNFEGQNGQKVGGTEGEEEKINNEMDEQGKQGTANGWNAKGENEHPNRNVNGRSSKAEKGKERA